MERLELHHYDVALFFLFLVIVALLHHLNRWAEWEIPQVCPIHLNILIGGKLAPLWQEIGRGTPVSSHNCR